MILQLQHHSNKAIVFLFVICVIILYFFRWQDNEWKNVIASDGKGYYNYLPAAFINKNLGHEDATNVFIHETGNGTVNKYFAGTAFLIGPFFFSAWLFALIFGFPVDGFSLPFQIGVSLAGLFHLFLGLYCLKKLLQRFLIKDRWIALTLIFTLLGTNLFYYSVYDSSMSHVYSFSMISCFLFSLKLFFEKYRSKYLIVSAFVFGIIILIRPVNGVVLFLIPFLAGSFNNLKYNIRSTSWITALIAFLLFLLPLSVQLVLWKLQTGHFIEWSYKYEGFYFFHPHFFEILFSYKKGWFIYTPMALLSLTGLFQIFKRSLFQFISITTYIMATIYITSSWWNWYYGSSFGLRAFVDHYAMVGLLLASSFSVWKKFRYIIITLAVVFMFLNLFQTWQYHAKILHGFNMTEASYWKIFLKTGKAYQNIIGGYKEAEPYSLNKRMLTLHTFANFEKPERGWNFSQTLLTNDTAHRNAAIFDGNEFGLSYTITNRPSFSDSEKMFVEIALSRYDFSKAGSTGALLVTDIRDKNENVLFYKAIKLNDIPSEKANTWSRFHYGFRVPVIKEPESTIKFYVWNTEKQKFLVDNFEIEIFTYYNTKESLLIY